ncbi:sulfite exporter TauE/SafE family protein [Chitinimonas sp. PSY-7]|uniref:urease accessory protein UreH domain-containing protein n=1 Tax=Chitinimonas sp. PSY-7 TaxID=3459088 RepID=UPI0040402F5F
MLGTLDLVGLAAWFLAGFLGGVHCLGMCGGLVTALGLNISGQRVYLLLAVNLGRLAAYITIGALLGGISGTLELASQALYLQTILYVVSQLLVVMLGLYLAGWSPWLARLERAGVPLWRHLQPRLSALLPLRSMPAALLAGAIWGWLPCGLVYTAATAALASGSALSGAAILAAFGLGTLPNLMAMGLVANQLLHWRQKVWLRQVVGLLLALYGVFGLFRYFIG